MNLIFQKDWITSMDPKFGSINMTSIFQKPVTRNAVIAVVQGVQLVSSGLNITNIDWPNLTMSPVGLPVLLSHEMPESSFCKWKLALT